jgi:hypothetical protein
MWQDSEDQDDHEDFLSESRMHVVFANGGSPKRAFGPYRTVQVTADSVWVFEGLTLLRIASKRLDGLWEIPDGSAQPATFRQLLILCPPKGATAAQIEERLSHRSQE